MGLLARILEGRGISTTVLSVARQITELARPPRAAYVRFPLGMPFGEPGMAAQQRTILRDVLQLIETVRQPGTIVDLPYRWRREVYEEF